MLSRHTGQSALEYIVVSAIVIAVIGAALIGAAKAISNKLEQINADIGS